MVIRGEMERSQEGWCLVGLLMQLALLAGLPTAAVPGRTTYRRFFGPKRHVPTSNAPADTRVAGRTSVRAGATTADGTVDAPDAAARLAGWTPQKW